MDALKFRWELNFPSQNADMKVMDCSQLFDPWRGPHYESGYDGVRTLVLGESAHLGGKTRNEFNEEYCSVGRCWFNDLIKKHRSGDWRNQYWTKWIKAFQGEFPSLKGRQEVLDKTAFYNFGDVMIEGSRMPLSCSADYQREKAREKFQRLCDALAPQLIVVLAYRLWDELPLHGRVGSPIDGFDTWHYTFLSTDSLALFLPHPCTSAWRSAKTHSAVKNALARVRCLDHPKDFLGGSVR